MECHKLPYKRVDRSLDTKCSSDFWTIKRVFLILNAFCCSCNYLLLCLLRLSVPLGQRHGRRRDFGTWGRTFCCPPSSGETWVWPWCRSNLSGQNIPESPASQNNKACQQQTTRNFNASEDMALGQPHSYTFFFFSKKPFRFCQTKCISTRKY